MRDRVEVMVVDDDPKDLSYFERELSCLGYLVISSPNSYDAIYKLAIREHSGNLFPDAILCDMLDREHVIARKRGRTGDVENVYVSMCLELFNLMNLILFWKDYFLLLKLFRKSNMWNTRRSYNKRRRVCS